MILTEKWRDVSLILIPWMVRNLARWLRDLVKEASEHRVWGHWVPVALSESSEERDSYKTQ